MKNILYITTELGNGGAERMIMSWIKMFNKELIHVDIIAQGISDTHNKKILESYGCKVINMPYRYREFVAKKRFIDKIISDNDYDAIHIHTVTALDYIPLKIAKQHGIELRIAHSHSSATGNPHWIPNFLHKCLKWKLRKYANVYLACSSEAGIHLFGKKALKSEKFHYIRNGIDTEKFRYNAAYRYEIRNEYNIPENCYVFGNVGRYDLLKRQDKVVSVFANICSKLEAENCRLILIGDGACRKNVVQMVKRLGLSDIVIFVPNTNYVYKYLSAMDLMLFPSEREGLSVALVEAQCSGLPCIATNGISAETKLIDSFMFLPVNSSDISWSSAAIKLLTNQKRKEMADVVKGQGYDIAMSAKDIQNIYLTQTVNRDLR